jgi:hypothetical protein
MLLARRGRIISLHYGSWQICHSPHNAVIYMSTLHLASRAVWCRSWAIFVGDIQKTRIRSVVGQVPQASLFQPGLIICIERFPFHCDLTCSRVMDGGDAPQHTVWVFPEFVCNCL